MEQFLTFILNHWLLSLAFITILGLLMTLELQGYLNSIIQLSPQDVVDKINRENAVVVDVRLAQEFAQGHIANAINVPLSTLLEQKQKIDKAKPVIVVCNRGKSSQEAAIQLHKNGFTQVSNLNGGLTAWREVGFPLVKQ